MRHTNRSRVVRYSQIKPIADRLTEYQGRMYMTKEDLKLFPEKVTLIPIIHERHHKHHGSAGRMYDAVIEENY